MLILIRMAVLDYYLLVIDLTMGQEPPLFMRSLVLAMAYLLLELIILHLLQIQRVMHGVLPHLLVLRRRLRVII